jgi:sperm-associated antigen 16 protein
MAASSQDEGVYALEQADLDEASDDGFQYDEVDVDALVGDAAAAIAGVDGAEQELEDIDKLLATVAKDSLDSDFLEGKAPEGEVSDEPDIERRPTVIDDFIRNYMIRAGLLKSLEAFNTEWFELKARGKLRPEDAAPVPDVYVRNQGLEDVVTRLRVELKHAEEVAGKARSTWDQFRKERDFHRMHHKRVVQEKTKLLIDLKRLKRHYEAYEPTIEELKAKYESAMKEKMLMRLERDRAAAETKSLRAQLEAARAATMEEPTGGGSTKRGESRRRGGGAGARMPAEDVINPFLSQVVESVDMSDFVHGPTIEGHENTVSALACHPSKPIVASASDDGTWRMWSIPSGELVMTGAGHGEWVADVAFHPAGTHLASSAGDGRVMIWDFATTKRAATLTDHTQVAWGVDWHFTGDFVASCSMDQTTKVWDITTAKCRQTLRGHVDSVNSVHFQPFSSNLVTGSGDKTLSLWDARSGRCIQVFVGHENAVNDTKFSMRGDTIASCDADGVVKLWDLRMVAERASYDLGEMAVNKLSWDRSSTVLAAACDDKMVHIIHATEGRVLGAMRGHDDHVQACVFDSTNSFLVTAGSDKTIRVWGRESDLNPGRRGGVEASPSSIE